MAVTAICLGAWLLLWPTFHGAAWLAVGLVVALRRATFNRRTRRRLTARWEALTH